MREINSYQLLLVFLRVIRHTSHDPKHHFLVIFRNAPIVLKQLFFPIRNSGNWGTCALASYDVQNIKAHVTQGLEIARVRAALVPFIASLRIPGDSTDLGHFFLFKSQSVPFFTQAFARTHLRLFCL